MTAPKLSGEVHHYQLRHKSSGKFLTNDDIYPDRDDVMGDQVILVLDEEKAHNLRFQYESEFQRYGTDVEVEVVGFDLGGHEVGVS